MATEETTTTGQKPKSISELLDAEKGEDEVGLDPAILERVDLVLPPEFMLEAMAEELLEHTATYHKAKAANKSARNSGDHAKAEQMFRLMAYSRLAAAIIQAENPGVKAIADQIAEFRAKRIKDTRATALAKED